MFAAIGLDGFAERARRELAGHGREGAQAHRRRRDELTPQEQQIARLARDGLSNPEIGARLFLSPRTVEWHLRKVFAKLGISSRRAFATPCPAQSGCSETVDAEVGPGRFIFFFFFFFF